MTPEQYHDRVLAELDTMRSAEKDAILIGFIAALYPYGDPDHPVEGTGFIAEAIRLLAAFHPDQLKLPEDQTKPGAEEHVPEF